MGKIYIIGLGPGNTESLTLGAINRINSGDQNYLRTEKHPTIEYFESNNIDFESYDNIYDEMEDFQSVYEKIAKDLIKKSKIYGSINYYVPGNPLVAEKTVEILMEKDIEFEIISGMSFIEPMIELVGRDPINGLKIVDGEIFNESLIDINTDMIITQVYNRRILTQVKLALAEIYGDEYNIYIVHNAGIEGEEEAHNIPIYMIDRIDKIGYLTSIYIKKIEGKDKKVFDINNLVDIIRILRGKDGCPWDRKQTHRSIRESVIEEAYEVVAAIDNEDIDNFVEELGDLLFQILFHSQIGFETGEFNLIDVTSRLANKMIFRHPHVFLSERLDTSSEVVYNWNELKDSTRDYKNFTDKLKSIPNFPALMRSYKLQERAAEINFDWDDLEGPLNKAKEEYNEVLDAIDKFGKGHERVEEELGDLLFTVVNLARFLDVHPEVALNRTSNKFISRFKIMEAKAEELNRSIENMSLEELDELWDQSKD